jgi:hypothetical protein
MLPLFRKHDTEKEMSLVEELMVDHYIESDTPLEVIRDERFRVRVLQGLASENTPRPGRYLVLEFRRNRWESIVALHECKLSIMMGVLDELTDYLGEINGPRRLRTVAIGNKRYFVDDRMMQLRNVNEPADFVDIPRGTPFNPVD